APSAITPAAVHHSPRSSRQPCHTSQAPPISASAASTNSRTERATITSRTVPDLAHPAHRGRGPAHRRRSPPGIDGRGGAEPTTTPFPPRPPARGRQRAEGGRRPSI